MMTMHCCGNLASEMTCLGPADGDGSALHRLGAALVTEKTFVQQGAASIGSLIGSCRIQTCEKEGVL
jgi:hypothetical protein